MLNEDLFMVDYRKKIDFVTPHSKYNVVLSLFTTSAARVCLYNYMDRVVTTPNCKLLYTGERSVGCEAEGVIIFAHLRH